jgi:outer membrane protein assembly factor BamE (lipoprotein component of BamABCDE complex)
MNYLVISQAIPHKPFRNTLCAMALLVLLLLAGCATVGHEFPAGQVSTIKIGETTQNDIYTTFGSPWRTGIDNGMKTWTYGHYRYSLFSEGSTEDLVVKFDQRGVVSSYVFNTSKRSK